MHLAPEKLPDWPAAMNQQMAAAYCGLSVRTFTEICPVRPVVFTRNSRGEDSRTGRRYLKARLDEWLFSLEDRPNAKRRGLGAHWDAKSETERA